ncbi:MAG: PAS domain-containing sensor histidine kinase, partial [Sulfuricurvum sp.]
YELQVHQIELEMQNEELRQAKIELDSSKKRYVDLYNQAPVGYCSFDHDGVILDANNTLSSTLNIPHDALIKQPLSRFIFKEDQDIYYLNRKKFLASNEPRSCELRMVKSDGTPFWAYLAGSAIREGENAFQFHLVITDISERKKLEEELKSNEQMMIVQSRHAAMGETIAMIAHQWRQPLNIVGLAIANIETKQSLHILNSTDLESNFAVISKNIAFMSETIDDFRNFFNSDQSKEYLKIENVLNTALKIIGKSLENDSITLTIQNNSQRALLLHKNHLIQLLLIILGNAKDAFKENKRTSPLIGIAIRETQETVIITICDNAGGIPESIVDKIAQPYFTTKQLNGTGLGLYIAQTIIEKYFSGTLTWHNEAQGSCFVITLKAEYQ